MRVLLAFDKFKHALTARAACRTAAEALRETHPDWILDECPLADGGEGFAEILTVAAGGVMHTVSACGPRGRRVQAAFGLVAAERVNAAVQARLDLPPLPAGSRVAVLEMAAASGLALLSPSEQNPWLTTTLGTGELIAAAQRAGAAAVLLGVGGSATNDLGTGALAALGVEFMDHGERLIVPPVPATWQEVARIRGSVIGKLPPLRIACDVTNPLLGPQGCAAVFAPQKGLTPADLPKLEEADARMGRMLCDHHGQPERQMDSPGAGAAGGLAFGLMVAAGARLVRGADLVATWLDLDRRVAAADLVLTGEGCFDRSSLAGKGPGALIALAQAAGKPIHVFAGRIAVDIGSAAQLHAISPPELPLHAALAATAEGLRRAVQRQLG
ncbi:glycerate kinase [Opitutus terrae]|uniref:Glycerate kinase n=1 Tax=Opitutus terrae (strain DSM 11246 / JCM 15787 / PB90-1) TaxID=452637 RepID=B1ZWW0_OPITP|nr:glycerate kinase [Opitutus terrae]ACB75071.1 Glycerate kinase [Opitutus terrae PB90-1]